MEDSYFVALGLRECGETIHAAVTGRVTGELVDHYELTHPGGGTCVVAVYEKHYYRAGNRLTLTVVLDDFTGRTRVHCISGGGGEGRPKRWDPPERRTRGHHLRRERRGGRGAASRHIGRVQPIGRMEPLLAASPHHPGRARRRRSRIPDSNPLTR